MSKKKNDWKDREGVVYSTQSDYDYAYQAEAAQYTLPPRQQTLRISLDKSGRAGKQVTLISGFVGKNEDLEELTRQLKSKCGTGGSCKDQTILIQGDVRTKVAELLKKLGYTTKGVG
jgi:translation initiation factor 1